MEVWHAIILGIVQGLAEFLPISSSGHLVMLQEIFGVKGGVLSFDIAIHFATLISVCIVYRQKIWEMFKNPFSKLPMFLVLGTVPVAVLGGLFSSLIESFFETGVTLGLGFIFTGLVLLYADTDSNNRKGLREMKAVDAFFVGVAQAVAMLPAVSRSGMTISGGLLRGLNRKFAADFAFLISIPAILGAVAFDVIKVVKKTGSFHFVAGKIPTFAGMLAAAISGYMAVKIMLKVIKSKKLRYFSYYVFILGILVLTDQLFFGIFFKPFF